MTTEHKSKYPFIDYSDPNNPIYRHEVAGILISFSIRDIPADRHEWFLQVFSSKLEDVRDCAVATTRKEIRTALHKALML